MTRMLEFGKELISTQQMEAEAEARAKSDSILQQAEQKAIEIEDVATARKMPASELEWSSADRPDNMREEVDVRVATSDDLQELEYIANDTIPQALCDSTNIVEIKRGEQANEENTELHRDHFVAILKAEAEEAFSKIMDKVETEADRLLEDARGREQEIIGKALIEAEEEAKAKSAGILQQAKQKAIEIEAEVTSRITQAKIQAIEGMDKYRAHNKAEDKQEINDDAVKQTALVAKEIQVNEPPPLDYLTGTRLPTDCPDNARGEMDREVIRIKAEARKLMENAQSGAREIEVISRAQMEAKAEGVGKAEQMEIKKSPDECEQDTIESQSAPVFEEKLPELFEGKVEMVIPPPINIARFIGITRYLRSTPGIKVVQTAGSWTTGCAIRLSLDRPLPLVGLLKDMPDVDGVKVLEEQDQPAWPSTLKSLLASQWGQKRISIATKKSKEGSDKESMSIGWEKNAQSSNMVRVTTSMPTRVV
jgi:hypothetical protein